jgi:hypothetical protein
MMGRIRYRNRIGIRIAGRKKVKDEKGALLRAFSARSKRPLIPPRPQAYTLGMKKSLQNYDRGVKSVVGKVELNSHRIFLPAPTIHTQVTSRYVSLLVSFYL